MGISMEKDNRLDIICQICRDGRVIPIKIKLTDDENTVQQYAVKAYKELESGLYVHKFACRIEVFGIMRSVVIYYTDSDHVWHYFPPSYNSLS